MSRSIKARQVASAAWRVVTSSRARSATLAVLTLLALIVLWPGGTP